MDQERGVWQGMSAGCFASVWAQVRADTKEAEHDKVWPHYSLSLGLPDGEKPIVGQRALRIPDKD